MNIIINNPIGLWLAGGVVGIAAILLIGAILRRRALRRYAAPELLSNMVPAKSRRRLVIRNLALLAGLVLLGLAAMDIRWGKTTVEVPRRGIDVIFALDVSRSMLARDVTPSRLTRAKQCILDTTEALGGDRVGLVTFAGKTRQVVPLTSSHSDVSIALDDVTTESVARGGSRLGAAIRSAAKRFLDKTADHKALVILTDGEDHGHDAVAAAAQAWKDRGVRVFTIVLGDSNTGGRIPLHQTPMGTIAYLQKDGKDVWTKANPTLMKKVALAGHGAFVPAGTKQVDMAAFCDQHISAIPRRDFQQGTVDRYTPRFTYFLRPALLLLAAESTLTATSRRQKKEAAA